MYALQICLKSRREMVTDCGLMGMISAVMTSICAPMFQELEIAQLAKPRTSCTNGPNTAVQAETYLPLSALHSDSMIPFFDVSS